MTKPEEYFDVVDARDAIVGRAARREVHARGLMHRAVHVLVYDGAGRVFLQKRSMKKDIAPGAWDSSCSGHVDSGESYDAAAVRELGEELGLRIVSVPERLFRLEACRETGWEFVWVYRLMHPGPFVLNADEIERGAWFTPTEVAQLLDEHPADVSPSFQHIWTIANRGTSSVGEGIPS
ncbi:MAG: NUDIX domain-containing protein [Opitutaceae bacterium]|jgi:isopentenyl-diphosphate delta-isomerase type 1